MEAKRLSPASSEMRKMYSGAVTWLDRWVRPGETKEWWQLTIKPTHSACLSTLSHYQELQAAAKPVMLVKILTAKALAIVLIAWVCGRRNPAEQEINNEPVTLSHRAANWKNSLCNPKWIHALLCSDVHACLCVQKLINIIKGCREWICSMWILQCKGEC